MASGVNPEELKRNAQYLNMRGAQMAQNQSGGQSESRSRQRQGNKKQLVGTIVGVIVVLAVLFVLTRL